MEEDPIVEELHKIRAELLEEHGGLAGYVAHLRELQEELRDRIVSLEPRPPVVPGRKMS
jgi:hypothetical protein